MHQKTSLESSMASWFAQRNSVRQRLHSLKITTLPGDASLRQYFRVKNGAQTKILMKMQPFVAVGEQLPFLQIQKHLIELGLKVPRIFDVDPKNGIILLQDLGDETLLKRLEKVPSQKEELDWFKKAIDMLVQMQVSATRAATPMDAYGLYFDEEKLMWEVQFTLSHFYNGFLAREIPAKERKRLESYFHYICKMLSSQDWYFTHRDFHARNIMVHDDLYMIDFQDARLGCPQYDLCSLLRDSYYQLEEDVVYELLDYYLKKKAKVEKKADNRKEFVRVFDLMSIQRNFKAIGSFASFYTKRQDVRYLKFIGNTFENIRRNLSKYPELSELRQLLFRYYYF